MKITMTNGFSCAKGLNPYQIGSYTYYVVDSVLYYSFYYMVYPNILIFCLNSILTMVVVTSCLLCTSCDPTDPEIYTQRKMKSLGKQYKTKLTQYCTVCDGYVQEKSKHCGYCNRFENYEIFIRCTGVFDHHCIWLNNCIGERNYKLFFVLVVGLNLGRIAKIILNIHCLVLGSTNPYFYISLAIDPFILTALAYLLIVHIYFRYRFLYEYFRWKGITTYEWIRRKREQITTPKTANANAPSLIVAQQVQHSTHKLSVLNHTSSLPLFGGSQIDSLPQTQKCRVKLQNPLESQRKALDDKWVGEIVEVDEQQSFHAQIPMQRPQLNFMKEKGCDSSMQNHSRNAYSTFIRRRSGTIGRQVSMIENIQRLAKDFHEPSVECEDSIMCIDVAVMDTPKNAGKEPTSDLQPSDSKILSPKVKSEHALDRD